MVPFSLHEIVCLVHGIEQLIECKHVRAEMCNDPHGKPSDHRWNRRLEVDTQEHHEQQQNVQ
jgi:hypothetical protein